MLKKQDFAGHWQISRQITDRMGGQAGQLTGIANFTEQADGQLLYQENGQLQLGSGPVMQATRIYRWQFNGNRVAVNFEYGAAFHSFVPHGYSSGTEHPCGDDIYTVRYDFIPWPRWRAVWIVTGPRKDYSSVTEFTR